MACSRVVNVDTEMGKISMYLNSGKRGLADRWARVVVKNGGISVVPWGGGGGGGDFTRERGRSGGDGCAYLGNLGSWGRDV